MEIETEPIVMDLERVEIGLLKPHPRNYKSHPPDQIEHLKESIREHGTYRNIVSARDHTILAGHGVVEAMKEMGIPYVYVKVLDLDPMEPRALKVMAGDNEIAHLGMVDDRALTEMLREIKESDVDGLLGTGYDDMMLANLLYVTRDASEIASFDAAAHWVGMPDYDEGEEPIRVVVSLRSEEDLVAFFNLLGMEVPVKKRHTWWPPKAHDDLTSVKFK